MGLIVTLGQKLDKRVLAEGVETERQLEFLRPWPGPTGRCPHTCRSTAGISRWRSRSRIGSPGSASRCGLLLFTWWLLALASGPEAFATVQAVVDSWFGALVLFIYTLVLFYHMGNGIRHLVWDFGYGFDVEVARLSGVAVLVFAGAMTLLVWLVIALTG